MKPQYSLYATHSQQNKIFFTKYYVKNIAFIKINIYNNRSPFPRDQNFTQMDFLIYTGIQFSGCSVLIGSYFCHMIDP